MPNDLTNAADNPLDPSGEAEQRIRERAYHLWESEGCIEGRDSEYWERARELEAISSSVGAALKPITTSEPVEEAAIQENLGEFPDRFADQGERQGTPMPRTQSASVPAEAAE